MPVAGRKLDLAAWAWVLIAGVAAFELAAHARIQSEIPSDQSWEAACAFVRARHQPSDRIVSAPSWVDPIVRRELGDLLSLQSAAPSDLAGVDRVWEIGIRGATTRDEAPALEERFGRVRVRMWPVSTDRIVYDFVEAVERAGVELVRSEIPTTCPWMSVGAGPGGLERGPMAPSERFVCDPKRPWLWVGATVLADLDLRPRRCVWQHPAGVEPVRVTFRDVPIGERLVIHGGIDYFSERARAHGPVTLRVWVDERPLVDFVHRDGDGWSRIEVETSELGVERAEVRFETTAPDPSARSFCWSASTRKRATDD